MPTKTVLVWKENKYISSKWTLFSSFGRSCCLERKHFETCAFGKTWCLGRIVNGPVWVCGWSGAMRSAERDQVAQAGDGGVAALLVVENKPLCSLGTWWSCDGDVAERKSRSSLSSVDNPFVVWYRVWKTSFRFPSAFCVCFWNLTFVTWCDVSVWHNFARKRRGVSCSSRNLPCDTKFESGEATASKKTVVKTVTSESCFVEIAWHLFGAILF